MKHASPEADWPTPTDVNNRCRITKGSDIPGDKKTKPEQILPKRIQTNDFQQSGTVSSRTRTSNNTAHHEDTALGPPKHTSNKLKVNAEASYKLSSKGHEMATIEECAPDPYEEKIAESHKLTLTDLVESEDETDSESEMDQEYSIEKASNRTYDTDDTSEKEKLDIFQPSGKICYGNPWKKCMTRKITDNSCIEKTEVENIDSQNANEKIEFKTGRKPKEAIEGDLKRFMYKYSANNSISWVQGRLTSRIDKLNDAVDSEWTMNRFRVNNIKNDQLNDTDDSQNKKLYLRYYEATCLSLAEKGQGFEGFNEYESCAMHHTYEISLLPPGKEVLNVSNKSHPFYESEGMMKRTIQQMTGSTLGSDIVASNEEIGTLSVITKQRIIRRVYLNDRVIPTEVDTCSLVSIIISDNPKLSRKLKIKRKLDTQPLAQDCQMSKGSHGYKHESDVRRGLAPHPSEDGIEISSDPSIVLTSDDRRRGGRLGRSDETEPKTSPPSVPTPRHTTGTYRNRKSQISDGKETIGTSEFIMSGSSNTGASIPITSEKVIMTPQENKENELFFIAPKLDHKTISMDTPRAGHRDTSMDTPKTGVATKEKTVKNRIPWWNELISKGKSEHKLKNRGVLANQTQRCASGHDKHGGTWPYRDLQDKRL